MDKKMKNIQLILILIFSEKGYNVYLPKKKNINNHDKNATILQSLLLNKRTILTPLLFLGFVAVRVELVGVQYLM